MPDDPPTDLRVHRISKELELLLDLRANLKTIIDTKGIIMEYQNVTAELRWNKYQTLCKAGFQPEQALALCKGTEFI